MSARVTDTRTMTVHPAFYSLQTKVNGNDQLPPLIVLGSEDVLTVGFDELAEDRRYMRYELIHCDALWMPDVLMPSEYLDGFNEYNVEDYAFSQATTAHYVHYEITLPNERMDMKLSGNYLLRVYDESDPDATLLQVRFSVVEPLMKVEASVSSRTDVDYNDAHQQMTLSIDRNGADVDNLFTDVIVEVQQNGRQDNTVYVMRPTRVSGSTMWFEHDPRLIFPAGNEYRRMEIISTTYPGMHVDALGYADPYYHAELMTDIPRADMAYQFDRTQHGRFRIREYNAQEPDTEADYMVTHFALDMPEQPSVDVFVDGDMFQRRFSPESRMVFNRATSRYELAAFLKQGAYNYQYLVVPRGSMKGYTSAIEGDKYQTCNEYVVKVYHRRPGARYDRLVGVGMAVSGI